MASFNEWLKYPTKSDDWYVTVLIGGVLTVLGILIIPLFLVYGYVIRVMRSRMAREDELPEFDDWGTLLVDGVKAWVIGMVYLLIPLVVALVTVGGAIFSLATGTQTGTAVGLTGLFGGLLLSVALGVVFWYLAVASIVNFARTGSLSAAFDVETIKAVILNGNYAMGWLVGLVVLIVAGAIGGMLNAIPFIGFVIAAFIYFYAQVVAALLWTDGFEASVDTVGLGDAPPADDPAV